MRITLVCFARWHGTSGSLAFSCPQAHSLAFNSLKEAGWLHQLFLPPARRQQWDNGFSEAADRSLPVIGALVPNLFVSGRMWSLCCFSQDRAVWLSDSNTELSLDCSKGTWAGTRFWVNLSQWKGSARGSWCSGLRGSAENLPCQAEGESCLILPFETAWTNHFKQCQFWGKRFLLFFLIWWQNKIWISRQRPKRRQNEMAQSYGGFQMVPSPGAQSPYALTHVLPEILSGSSNPLSKAKG